MSGMRNANGLKMVIAGAVLTIALAACGKAEPAATASPAQGASVSPAASVQPTASAAASATPAATPAPSATPGASASASPAATASVQPSATAAATPQASAAPTATPTPSASATPQPAAAGPVSVEASFFKWTLSQTEFAAGAPIHFVATSKQGVHGFSIVGTDVNVTVQPGEAQDVTWTPDKPGEYTIKCSLFCGTGHSQMETTIIVK